MINLMAVAGEIFMRINLVFQAVAALPHVLSMQFEHNLRIMERLFMLLRWGVI